jgi:hypothetical protein
MVSADIPHPDVIAHDKDNVGFLVRGRPSRTRLFCLRKRIYNCGSQKIRGDKRSEDRDNRRTEFGFHE